MRNIAFRGYLIGVVVSIILLGCLSLVNFHHLRAPGEFNTGHEGLACIECHESADGTLRQQIQANISYLFGQRSQVAGFNFRVPNNKDCLACHEREDDSHPVYRFNEPRFLEAREAIKPQYCVSCHQEHKGVRVTSSPENCQYCHAEIEVKNDPLDISHADLSALQDWDTCMGCHDFHGNHVMETAISIKDMLDKNIVQDFLDGGKDPYSENKTAVSKEARYEN